MNRVRVGREVPLNRMIRYYLQGVRQQSADQLDG